MSRYFYLILTFITLVLCEKLTAQNGDFPLKTQRIVVINEQHENLPFLPLTLLISGEVFHTTTDEKGELQIPQTQSLVTVRIAQEFGTLLDDSFIKKNQTHLKVASQLSKINPISISTGVSPRSLTDNPYSVQIISQKTIGKMAAQNVGEVLQNQSGILIAQDPNLGTSIQLQGMGGQNVKILVNGIPMIGRLNGNIDISQIPTESIERIEIIEGPMSVVYGTDAIGGIINIITKSPVGAQKQLQIKTYNDQRGNFNQDLGFSHFQQLKGKNSGYQGFDLNLGRQFFAGVDFQTNTRSFDWKPKTKWFGDLQWKYRSQSVEQTFRYAHFYEYLLDRSNAEYNLININGYNNYFNTQRRELSSISYIKLNKRHSLRFQNALNHYERDKINVRRNLVTGQEIITRPEDQDTTVNWALNFRGLWEFQAPNKIFNTLLGYEFQSEILKSFRVPNQDPITDLALFGSLEYTPIKKLNIKPSLRIAANNTFGNHSIGWGSYRWVPVIPAIQIKSNISEHITFRGSYAKGFRAPNAKEMYFLFVDINHNVQGNPSLNPEHAHNFNGSVDYRHAINQSTGATFKLSGFYNQVSNQIQLSLVDVNTNLYQYINVRSFNTRGFTGQTQIFIGTWDIQMSYSFISNQSKFNLESAAKSWVVPQGTFNVSYEMRKWQSTLNFFSRYTGKTLGFKNDGSQFELASYWLSDVNLSKRLWNSRLNLQLGVKNLFNITQIQNNAAGGGIHATQGGINIGMGRNIFVQCTVNLNR